MPRTIYLAGPDVFLPDALEVGERKKILCRQFGFEGLFPLDNEKGVENDAARNFHANCHHMRQADIGLFNLTLFRGPSADAGTAFELGFCFALDKPVHGYSSTAALYVDRVARFQGPPSQRGLRKWDASGCSVEDFGLMDNLMIAHAIESTNGTVTIVEESSLAALEAFEARLQVISRILG